MKGKSILIITILCSIGLITIGILSFILFNKDKDKQFNVSVDNISVLKPLDTGNSAEAAKMVKENIVKIVNTIDEDTTIYGTGFFHENGYLVTNSHVVDIEGEIKVIYFDGTSTAAKIYSNDILSDLAILVVDKLNAKALPFESTINLEVTNELYSIGYQFNLDGEPTVTKGILSAKRSASGIEFLQTDAAVNPGSSGGPVINDKGQLLGIVTLASDNASMSMAISSDSLDLYINKLVDSKEVNYLTEERPANALGSVLKNVGYSVDDIYNEKHIFHKDDKDKEQNKDYDNKGDNDKGNNNQVVKDISITPKKVDPIAARSNVPRDISKFFILGKDLTNCTLHPIDFDFSTVGTYQVKVVCNENYATNDIQVYEADPLRISNVTSFEQIAGVWYYQSYSDVCIAFTENNGYYSWDSHNFDASAGRVNSLFGGGNGAYSFEDLIGGKNFHIEGNELTISNSQTKYTVTRNKGSQIYDTEEAFHFCDNY